MNIKPPILRRKHRAVVGAAGARPFGRGVFLMEMIAYVAMLSVALLVLANVFAMLMQTWKDTAVRDVMIGRMDLALDTLRRDAWSATEMKTGATAANRVELKEPGGTITWQMGDDGVLTRTDGGAGPGHTWTWTGMPKVSFAVQNALLIVQVDSGPAGRKHEQVALVSQRMAGGRS